MANLFVAEENIFSPLLFSGCSTTTWCNQQLELNGAIQSPALVQTSSEVESARILAQQELHQMEVQALHLLHLLNTTMQERDEARRLLCDHHNNFRLSRKVEGNSFQQFSLDEGSGESGVNNTSPELMQVMEAAVKSRGLPEKGRLVDAVMSAGPLLQMLLLAGPLPQWQHPPPELRCSDIPPVSIGHPKCLESNCGGGDGNGVGRDNGMVCLNGMPTYLNAT